MAKKNETTAVVATPVENQTEPTEIPAKNPLSQKAASLMEQLKVSEIYANSKGEFFTTINPALLSESGVKSKIQIFRK